MKREPLISLVKKGEEDEMVSRLEEERVERIIGQMGRKKKSGREGEVWPSEMRGREWGGNA